MPYAHLNKMADIKPVDVNVMAIAQHHHSVLVLDYGSQYTQLITRRIREAGIFSVLFPGDASFVSACVVLGGPCLCRCSIGTDLDILVNFGMDW